MPIADQHSGWRCVFLFARGSRGALALRFMHYGPVFFNKKSISVFVHVGYEWEYTSSYIYTHFLLIHHTVYLAYVTRVCDAAS